MISGLASLSIGNSVTTANGSDVPLKAPATFVNPVALMESCSFIIVLFDLASGFREMTRKNDDEAVPPLVTIINLGSY